MLRRDFGLIWSQSQTLNPAPAFLVENMRIAAACRQFCSQISGRSLSSDEMKSGRMDRKGSIPDLGLSHRKPDLVYLVSVPIGIDNTMLTGGIYMMM